MNTVSARLAGIIVGLYLGYEILAAIVGWAARGPDLAAGTTNQDASVLQLAGTVLTALPFGVSVFLIFWLWPPRSAVTAPVPALSTRLPGVIGRAAVAVSAGAVLYWLVNLVGTVQITGGWFTSLARDYTVADAFWAQTPGMLVSSVTRLFPLVALCAVLGALLVGRGVSSFDRGHRIE